MSTEREKIEDYRDEMRIVLINFTKKAYQILPKIENPRILDIGCGSGIPTMELAKLSGGDVIGIDIEQPLLDRFSKKIDESGLSDRVKAVNCSLFKIDYPDESFNIIWAEGSINIIGFERALKEWGRLLKPNGFFVVHDDVANVPKKIKQISEQGYELLAHFEILEDVWWDQYFRPLEKKFQELRLNYPDDEELLRLLSKEQHMINLVKKDLASNARSMFYIIKK